MSDGYSIANPPPSAEWLALSEEDRVELVRRAHERLKANVGQSPHAHAAMHVAVENQLAEGYAPAVEAYERFRAAGVDRHNAVHALASVVAQQMMQMLETKEPIDEEVAKQQFAALDPTKYKRPR